MTRLLLLHLFLLLLPLPLPLLLLLGCSGGSSGSSAGSSGRAELEANRALWESQGLQNYSFLFKRTCFCTFAGREVEVEVRNGAVTGARDIESGEEIENPADNFPSIDGLFEILQSAVTQPADKYEASFNEQFGYPQTASIDRTSQAADDELSWEVTLRGGVAVQQQCGPTLCAEGMVCCNASCGICTPPDGACIQIACE